MIIYLFQKFLKQEISHHTAFLDTEKNSNSLLASRTSIHSSINANKKKIDKLNRDVKRGVLDAAETQDEIEALQRENEIYAEDVDKL